MIHIRTTLLIFAALFAGGCSIFQDFVYDTDRSAHTGVVLPPLLHAVAALLRPVSDETRT